LFRLALQPLHCPAKQASQTKKRLSAFCFKQEKLILTFLFNVFSGLAKTVKQYCQKKSLSVVRGVLPFVLLIVPVFLSACQLSPVHPSLNSETPCKRIVSLSPSITESLYSLELDKELVGVTRFCKYPEAATHKPQVGGYLDPDKEALVRLKPTIVMLRTEQQHLKHELEALGIQTLSLNHGTVEGIRESFEQIGQTCQIKPRATAFVARLDQKIRTLEHAIRTRRKPSHASPSVLLVLDREFTANSLKQVFVAGQDGFYDWLITHAGGQPAFSSREGFFPISTEGLYALDPDIIIEILPSLPEVFEHKTSSSPWQALTRLKAVQHHQVYTLREDYLVIPGPRFVQILETFGQIITPKQIITPFSKLPDMQ
jgi:iron complex transport system substrate-binding protein